MNYEIVANHGECHSLKKNSHRFGHSTTLLMETLLTLRTWLPRLLVDSSVLYRVASFYGVHHLASHLFTTTLEQPPNWPEPRFVYKISNYIIEYCLQCSLAEMRYEPDRTGPGRGPGARSTSRYSEVWVRILNLWNSQASRLYCTNSSSPLSHMFITRLPFRIKHSHARSCVTRSSVPCLPHLASSIPTQPHIHFSRLLILPVPMTRYYMFMVYPKSPDLFLRYTTISWFDTLRSLISTLHSLTYEIQRAK